MTALRRWFHRLPDWTQGLLIYAVGVALICGLPLIPAWLAFAIYLLVK